MSEDLRPLPLVTVARVVSCAAAVLLASAVGLGLWSLFGASTTVFGAPDNDEKYSRWDGATADHIAWWALGGAAVVLVGLVAALRGRRWSTTLVVALGAGIVVVASAGAYPGGIFHTYSVLSTKFAPSQALPAAMSAWVLTVVGCLAVVLAGLPLLGRGPASRRELTIGAIVGLVAVGAIGWPFLRAADPDRNVDATTASEVAAREVPIAFGGTPRFTMKLENSDWNTIGGDIGFSLRAAGPGFVVRARDGVRAFDPAGQERWHFRHVGGWRLADFRVFDAGATVVVTFTSGETPDAAEVFGLDATTGRQLWRSADPALLSTFGHFGAKGARPENEPLYLTVQDGEQLSRVDTRTGRQQWSVPIPKDFVPLDTGSGVGYFTGVTSGDRAEVHYVSLRNDSGDVRFDVVASTYSVKDIDNPRYFAATEVFAPTHAGRDGIVFKDRFQRPFYVNGQTGTVTPFDGQVMFATVAAEDFIAQPLNLDGPDTLRGPPDGKARCALPKDSLVPPRAWLRDEAVSITGGALTAYRRSDCSVVPTGRIEGDDLVPAHGVLLVVKLDVGGTTTIAGYA